MTKSKITAATLTALTLAGTLAATSGTAQAHHWGTGVGIGIGAAAVTSTYGGPVYVTPGYRAAWSSVTDRWGNIRVIRVCDC
ncbi:MAG: hypothetical protein WA322_17680 [Pseudolabrys sp.]